MQANYEMGPAYKNLASHKLKIGATWGGGSYFQIEKTRPPIWCEQLVKKGGALIVRPNSQNLGYTVK